MATLNLRNDPADARAHPAPRPTYSLTERRRAAELLRKGVEVVRAGRGTQLLLDLRLAEAIVAETEDGQEIRLELASEFTALFLWSEKVRAHGGRYTSLTRAAAWELHALRRVVAGDAAGALAARTEATAIVDRVRWLREMRVRGVKVSQRAASDAAERQARTARKRKWVA